MSETVLIYGHSDDVIEVEGAINAELPAKYGEPTVIEFSDGRRFEVEYDGYWEITPLNMADDMAAIDYSSVDVTLQEELPNVTNDYTQVAVYQSWNGVEGVEVVK
jgi:hypothetical protein